jgi:D-glycero-beta-D-manno-heptose-7-phosphate kinase
LIRTDVDMQALFEKMNHLRILVVGDVMADAYIRGKVDRISPEAPVPVINVRESDIRLGGAANVALNLKALGAQVMLCCLVGDDAKGQTMVELIEEAEIDARGVVKSPFRPTTIKTRVIAGGQHLLRIDEEDDRPAREEEKTALLKIGLELLEEADALIFEDYDKGVIFRDLIQTLTVRAREKGIPVTVDPKKRNFADYGGAHLFKPNLKELREGLKIELNPKNQSDIREACERARKELGVEGLLLTLSENGMAILMGDFFMHTPAMERDIADVSGAGDTVISVATACLAAGCSPQTTLLLANLAGGLVCEYSGVVPVKKDVLLAEASRWISA